MAEQPKLNTYEPTPVFADGTEARPLVAGTVARHRATLHRTRFPGRRFGTSDARFEDPHSGQSTSSSTAGRSDTIFIAPSATGASAMATE